MAAAPSTTTSQFRNFIECPVCFDIFNDPRVLPCQHSFCLRCLQGTWATKQPNDTVHCLICREGFVIPPEGVCGIRKDHRANSMIDAFDRNTADKSHFCIEHKDKALDRFCRSCKTAICSSCVIGNHAGHNVSKECEFLDESRKQMAEELQILSGFITDIERNVNKISFLEADTFLKEIDSTEEAINKRAEELKLKGGNRQLIEQQRLSLVKELSIIKQKQLKEIMKEKEEMENHSSEIESMKRLCNTIKRTEVPIEIGRAMAAFRTTSDKLGENHRAQMERQLFLTKVSFQATTSGEDRSKQNSIGSITAVKMRLIKKLNDFQSCLLTKLENKIYALRGYYRLIIFAYEDQNPFSLRAEIDIKEIQLPADMASSETLKCLYVIDPVNNCIWKITVGDHRVTRWLSHVGDPFTLSVTSDDHILNLRDGGSYSQLEIYGSDANIIRILPLSTDIQWPLHAIQKPSKQFIISHRVTPGCSGPWVISQLTNDGKIVNRFHPKDIPQTLDFPWHLSLDTETDRMLLANRNAQGVMLFDSNSLNFIQSHLTQTEMDYARFGPMYYDVCKKQLLLGQKFGVCVYELSEFNT